MSFRSHLWPIGVSLAFHGAIVAFVVVGWESSSQQTMQVNPPRHIEAKLVELTPKAKQAPAKPQTIDLTKQRREQELERQREQERLARERRQRELREKREAEERRKREEQKRREEREARERAEREARERQERLEQQRRQEQLEQALREEQGMLMEDSYATQASSYMDAIARRIEQHWSRPPSARREMQATLAIQLVPTGRVVNVTVVKGSGNAAFDRSAVQAVRQVEVFPEVKEMSPEVFERYYRQFNLLFKPQDLRQ